MQRAPILYVGLVGVGKTACVKAQYNGRISAEILSGWMPEDILGLPVNPKDKSQAVVRLRPDWHVRICRVAESTVERVCLFFDELDKARRDVADACLTLIQEREIGGWKLPDNVDIAAAANPPSVGGGDGISDAMRTRFRIVEFVPNVAQWVKWARAEFKKSPGALAVIDAIAHGELPLLDHHQGESWCDSRDANPRTWAFALAEIAAGNFGPTGPESLLPGALAGQAQRIAMQNVGHEEQVALGRVRMVCAPAKKKAYKPLGL